MFISICFVCDINACTVQYQRHPQCVRTLLYLGAQIAAEYKATHQYEQALKYVSRRMFVCVFVVTQFVCPSVLGITRVLLRRVRVTDGGCY